LLICGIYCIRNLVNGKVYVGQSRDIKKRFTEHKRRLRNNRHANMHLQKSWAKYGSANFTFEILEECFVAVIDEREMFYISKYEKINGIYNLQEGGSGGIPSEEIKIKIRDKRKHQVITEETRRKISEANKGHTSWTKGKTQTEETKRKIRKSTKESMTNEVRQKMSKSHMGIKMTKETKKKISEANKGKKFSSEHRLKISEAAKRRIYTEETKQKISDAKKGKLLSIDHRRAISESHKGEANPFYGKKHSDETRKKMRDAHKRRNDQKTYEERIKKIP